MVRATPVPARALPMKANARLRENIFRNNQVRRKEIHANVITCKMIAASSGSLTPSRCINARRIGYKGGQRTYGCPENDANPLPLSKLRLVNKYSAESREVPSPYLEILPHRKIPHQKWQQRNKINLIDKVNRIRTIAVWQSENSN